MDTQSSSHKIDIRTLTVSERLDALRAGELRQALADAIDDGVVRIVVDLSETTFVDSAGLAALAKGMKDCRAGGGDLRVVGSQHPDASRVFSLTRFDQVFMMGDSAQELVESW